MNPVNVTMRLRDIHCRDEGDGWGSAEPYLWTVFFKIDGERARVNRRFQLEGRASIRTSPGNHGNLPNHDVDEGETVRIPASIGEFRTILRPIPLDNPIGDNDSVGGAIGCIAVLMEEDNTKNRSVAKGHDALNRSVQAELDRLISTLGIIKPEPTEQDIADIESKVARAVTNAIKDDVSAWDWFKGFGNMDDKIGSAVFRFSHSELESARPVTRRLNRRWRNEGDWELRGDLRAVRA